MLTPRLGSFSALVAFFVATWSCSAAMAEETEGTEGSRDSIELDEGLYAQPQPDDWNYALRLNGWLPSLNGTVGIDGVKTDVDLPISTILDHLNMTFQTSFAARKGRWGFAADIFYVKLSGGTAKEKTTMISDLGLDIKEAFGQGTVFYRAMDWDGGRGFLDVGAGARIFGLDMSLDIGRDDAGVDAFSQEFASTAVDKAVAYIDAELKPLIEQELGPALEQAARERIGQGLSMLADEVGNDLTNAIRNQVLGEVGTRLGNRLTGRGPVGDAIDRMIEATAQERLAEAERSRAEAEQTVIDAKADATEAEKALAAQAAAEKQALAAKASAERQQAEESLAQEIDGEIKRNWEDEVSGSRSWVDPIVAVRMRHWLNRRVFLNLYGDVGGFGVGSRLTWAAAGGLGYQAKDDLALELYYRVYSVDYENDGFLYDATLHGVFAGLAYHF
jgi:hypothetical protein